MSSTSPFQGVRAPYKVMNEQSLSQLSHPGSEPEGTQGQIMQQPPKEIHYAAPAREGWLIAGLLYRLLWSLLHLVLLRRFQKNDSEKQTSPQPAPTSGIHTSIGDNNEDSGCIRGSGKITITYNIDTMAEGGGIQGEELEKLANSLTPLSARGGTDNKGCSKIEDSGGLNVVYNTGTKARGVHGERNRKNLPSTTPQNSIR